MLILFRLAGLHQSEEHFLTFIQMQVFVRRYIKANDLVEFSKECFLHHHRCPVGLVLIKINLGLILVAMQ